MMIAIIMSMAIERRKGGSVADCEETFDWD